MKVLFKKIRTFCIVAVLSVSLTVSNTAAVTYQAAAIPVVYSSWQVLVTILALLGITICAAPELEDDAAQELMDAYVHFKVLKGEGQGDSDGDGEDDLFATFDPLDYLTSNNQLQMSQEDLEAWQQFYYENMAPEVTNKPVNSVDISKMNYEEFYTWAYEYFDVSKYSGSSSWSNIEKFFKNMYNTLESYNYSGVVFKSNTTDTFYFDIMTRFNDTDSFKYYGWSWKEEPYSYGSAFSKKNTHTGSTYIFLRDSYSSLSIPNNTYKAFHTNSAGVYYGDLYTHIEAFILNGQLFDASIFTLPIDATTSLDYGSFYSYNDFVISTNNLGSSLSDVVNTIVDTDLSDLLADQSFDVIGNGREWDDNKQEAVGDIVVPMPAPEVITDYSNGDLSYEDFMSDMDMTPIDESTGTNLLTQQFLTTQTGIFQGVNSLVDLVQAIWNWLNNFFDSLVQALIDMIMSLLVPSDGFIDGKIGLITAKLDSLGVAPYDMSGLFDSDDRNPFQNIVIDVNGQEVVIVSFDYLPPFLDKFRPVIRGLLVLFLVYYSINQLLSLIRLSGMLEGGNFNTLQAGSGSNAPALDVGMNTPKLTDKGGRV